MKKKIILAISVMLVFGLAIAAFAYTKQTNNSNQAAMECCCKGKDSCPMKNKTENASAEKKDCCDSPDCCCKGGDSCPMKNKTEKSSQTVETKNVTVASSEENCDKPCCKKKS